MSLHPLLLHEKVQGDKIKHQMEWDRTNIKKTTKSAATLEKTKNSKKYKNTQTDAPKENV
jgi:hypothetical protein